MDFIFACCISFAMGAGIVILTFKTFEKQNGIVVPQEDLEQLETKIEPLEKKVLEEWQAMMDYDPYKPQDNRQEGSELDAD